VEYLSGNLRLKAWVNQSPGAAGRRWPAVLFLHGGFAFGAEDWEQAQPFRDAGFVVMTPMLRGENGLPGSYSMFYDEIDDVLAAADSLGRLPYVDNQRLYVAGHSVGGTMALLAAMTPKRFRAAASFSGSPDQVAWARGQEGLVPFDPADQQEFQMRSALAFPRSFKCPVRLYYGTEEFLFAASSAKTAQLAQAANLDVEAVSVPGDHLTSVAPAMRQCIPFFQQH
jgi:dipeptidyl aminopeptidase/acylaminoacyl peptidase